MLQNLQNKKVISKGAFNKVEFNNLIKQHNITEDTAKERIHNELLINFMNELKTKIKVGHVENNELSYYQLQAYVFTEMELMDLLLEICDLDDLGREKIAQRAYNIKHNIE